MKRIIFAFVVFSACGGSGGDAPEEIKTPSNTINTFDCATQEVGADVAENAIDEALAEGKTVEDNRTEFSKTVVIANCGSTVVVDNSTQTSTTETNIANVEGSNNSDPSGN